MIWVTPVTMAQALTTSANMTAVRPEEREQPGDVS
jgi:hypothetical protein